MPSLQILPTRDKVCKTFIHRFDSDPRLEVNYALNQSFAPRNTEFPHRLNGHRKPSKSAKTSRIVSESLAQSLARRHVLIPFLQSKRSVVRIHSGVPPSHSKIRDLARWHI